LTSQSPEPPSLDVIRAELDERLADQDRKGTAFDGRAGLILGFGGVLIGLAPDDPSLLQLFGQIAAALAAGAAGWALWFRVSSALAVRPLRERYLMHEPKHTKLRVLDTRIMLYEQDEERLESKVRRLKLAVGLLAVAVVLMLAGSIVNYAQGSDPVPPQPGVCHGRRDHREFARHSPGAAPPSGRRFGGQC
jgi:hypothetical protein